MKNVLVLCFKREFDLVVKTKLAKMKFNILSFSENLEKKEIIDSIEKFRTACGIVVVYESKKSSMRGDAEDMKKMHSNDDVEFIKI